MRVWLVRSGRKCSLPPAAYRWLDITALIGISTLAVGELLLPSDTLRPLHAQTRHGGSNDLLVPRGGVLRSAILLSKNATPAQNTFLTYVALMR